ncbi:helix-turn-helix domain-containing protein [Microcella alkalica]|uniref:helix-turn-helix domain-containing protein n=1 Tax=Microcella alkalica TaxID=355930 RepID=UPI00145F54D4|nr:helix-turn-helix domain-containing protein [Microcella alkalica]
MTIANRPPEHYLHGDTVIVPSWACAFLYQAGNFETWTANNRGKFPHADNVLIAIRLGAKKWREQIEGTRAAPKEERPTQSEWLTTSELADHLGFTTRGARKACAEGRIEAELVDGRYRISRTALAHYRARHQN